MRAPMAVKAISQFLSGVIWGELDYLIVDLPPGTGDIQLSFAQQAQLKGAVIVTTPQKMALDISAKGLDLFKNVNVPILGIIENMSGFECGHCGKTTHIFSSGGGEKLSQDKGVPFLGHIPLDAHVMASADDGEPIVQKFQDSTPAQSFIQMAKNLHQELEKSQSAASKLEPENIEIYEDNGSLKINWKDNTSFEYPAFALRLDCPCASCVDEATGVRTLKEEDIDLNIKVLGARPVGRYGLALQFSDGHGTGIYRFNRLREFMEKESQEVNL
jgi:ATP-binding protein involved in chromosome partitioning